MVVGTRLTIFLGSPTKAYEKERIEKLFLAEHVHGFLILSCSLELGINFSPRKRCVRPSLGLMCWVHRTKWCQPTHD
jgi:hypothetical protein